MITYRPLRELLKSKGMTIKELMREVGFTTNVAVALTNDKPITLNNLVKICIYFNVPIEWIVAIELPDGVF